MSKTAESENLPVIGITCGDINGIGLEVIIKTFGDNRMLQMCTPVVYASAKAAVQYRKNIQVPDFGFHQVKSVSEASNKNVNLLNVYDADVKLEPGLSTPEAGKVALAAIKAAISDLKENKIQAVITAPINKSNIQSPEFNFAGHTEYFAQEFDAKEYLMLLTSDELKIGTVTGHIPISQVSSALTIDKIASKARLLNKTLIEDFGIRKPIIAILGLNPHAGDNGVIGDDEKKTIIPAIEQLKNEGLTVFGPFGADGFFGSGAFKKYDAVLSMYHDQGLIPFKTLAFETGVNYTAGLPIVRTSPDHGTGYDMMGKNKANESSFRYAIYLALDIIANRKLYAEINENVLKITRQKKERNER